MNLAPLFSCLSMYLAIAFLDVQVKGRVVVRAERLGIPWDSVPAFWHDEGLACWRGILAALAVAGMVAGCREWGWIYAAHALTLWSLEHWAYWQWDAILEYQPGTLRVGQKGVFDEWHYTRGPRYYAAGDREVLPRVPRLGEVPYRPTWLRIGPVSLMWYHRPAVIGGVVAANAALAVMAST